MDNVAGQQEDVDSGVMRIGKRCYVGNLAWKTSWQDLKDLFRSVGTVVYSNVMRDEAGRSKGWGIVEFETPEEAVAAVNTFNGEEMAGRKILVREDREDRDVKQYNKENGIERPEGTRPPRRARTRGGGAAGAPSGPHNGDGEPRPPRREPRGAQHAGEGGEPGVESSGLQVVVQGIPWKYEDADLHALFEGCGAIEEAKVVIGKDARSRGYGTVRFGNQEDAQKAITDHHGTDLEGRTLTVKFDKYA